MTVVDVDIKFGTLLGLMLKTAIAAIPALFILFVLKSIAAAIFMAAFSR